MELSKIHCNDRVVEMLSANLLENRVAFRKGVAGESVETFEFGGLVLNLYHHRPRTTAILETISRTDDVPWTTVQSICAHWPDHYDEAIGSAIITRSVVKKYINGESF